MNQTESTTDCPVSRVVTGDHRVQIPIVVIRKIDVEVGGFYDIYCNGKLKLRKICADGSIRIGDASMPSGATASIIVKDNKIYISTT